MDPTTIFAHEYAPLAVLTGSFIGIAFYYETKPQIIALGVMCIVLAFMSRGSSNGKVSVDDYDKLRTDNEKLKQNLMHVYNMVQNKQQERPPPAATSGPPPPIPPTLTAPSRNIPETQPDDEEGKPYL